MLHHTRVPLFLIIGLWCASVDAKEPSYQAFEAIGPVINVHDGDTLKLWTEERIVTVRFSGSDTPETGQAYWRVARDRLRALVRGQPTTISCYKKDMHARDVCRVYVGTQDVGLEMVREGLAWHAYQFDDEQTSAERVAYKNAESDARAKGLGLWADSAPMPPWECRKLRRTGRRCR
ncbi:thermonuclease family protein [Rhodocyclus tenuis]|uniref:Thermonuclease family protein n=1 Tax=Rhodocyclus gracilis TaxID=2929842 RepID=A0ABX0WKA4_9RHOO|nr:thermonuclease family protein [Rhodocyclus gracilis]NJA90147.1 thermonuclease family protein [Rhodocyclus gracilis]